MRPQPSILVVTNSYPNPYKLYAGKYVERHVLLHRDAGLGVTVLTPGDSRRGLIRSTLKYANLFWQVLCEIFSPDFDLVHAHWVLPSGFLGMLISKWRRKPFVLTSHGAFTDSFSELSWLERQLVRVVLHSADVVITVGKQQMRNVTAIAGSDKREVRCIDMGVWLAQNPPSKLEAREMLGLPRDEKLVIFIGNLIWRKGSDILIEAAAKLVEEGQKFRLIIGGQGEEEQNVLGKIDNLGLNNVANVIGSVPPEDVFTWFSAADVCVVPSRTEPFGLVAIEAMSCGTVVIASEVGGLSENIIHGENGLLFPVGDHLALAKCLKHVLTNDDWRDHIAKRGRQTAASYDMKSRAAEVQAVYERLLDQ